MSCLAEQTPVQAAKLFHPRTFCDFVCSPQKNIPEREGSSIPIGNSVPSCLGQTGGGGVIGTPVPTTLTSIEVLVEKEKDERRVEEGGGGCWRRKGADSYFILSEQKASECGRKGGSRKVKMGGQMRRTQHVAYTAPYSFSGAPPLPVLAFFRLRICTNVQLPPQEFFLHLKKMAVK